MAGIVGVIGNIRRQEAVARVEDMLMSMSYEPFYTKGSYVNEALGLYAGWLVHPNSFCDCMPIENEDGSIALLLHGEVFTSSDRLHSLRRLGHRFSDLDASHLVHLYEEINDGFFEELNGTFSGILANSHTKTVQLFNDRIGFEKLYYCEDPDDGTFHFSSEAKSILRVIPQLRQFDREGLAQFVAYGCTFDNTTLYKGLSLLPPASVWEFASNTAVRKKTYFRPGKWRTDPEIGVGCFQKTFNETFRKVLPRYFAGNLRVGVSLTGGWDTRMIMACHRAEPSTLPCYTFSGLSGDTVDVAQARKVASVAEQNHAVLRLESDFLSDFAQHAKNTVYVSDGNAGVCVSHELYLNRLARGVAAVRVTGNFGSEVLRGMTTFKEIPLRSDWLHGELKVEIARCRERLKVIAQMSPAQFAIFKEIPWKHAATVRLASSQLPVRSPFLDNEILRLACTCAPSVLRESALPVSLIRSENRDLLSVPTDRGESGEASLLGGAFRRVLYSGTFKLDYLLNEGAPDFLSVFMDGARLYSVMPVRHRYLDYRRWFKGPLFGYVEDVLSDGNNFVSGLLGTKAVRRVLRDHASGMRNELAEINALLTLELIDRYLLRAPALV